MANDLLYCNRINNLSYDAGNEVLSVNFYTGNIRDYSNVPDTVYRKFESSTNQNKYFENKIYGKYPTR